MYIRNGQPIDFDTPHIIDDVQYPAGVLYAVPELWAGLGIYEVPEPAKPVLKSSQAAELSGFAQSDGGWQPVWDIRTKTQEELSLDMQQLKTAKAQKIAEINKWREAANSSTFPHNGKHIAIDNVSFKDIAVAAGYIALFNEFPPDWPGGWKYTDNSVEIMLSIEDFKSMYKSLATKGTGNFNHAQELKMQVEEALTIAQVDAIQW